MSSVCVQYRKQECQPVLFKLSRPDSSQRQGYLHIPIVIHTVTPTHTYHTSSALNKDQGSVVFSIARSIEGKKNLHLSAFE